MNTRTAMMISVAPRAFASQPPSIDGDGSLGYMKTTPEAVQAAKRFHGTASGSNDALLCRARDMAAMVDYWDLTDTIIDGVDAMRNAGEAFMPRFTDEDNASYQDRLKCVKMTNVYRDGVEGLSSKPFEQEITLVEDEGKTIPDDVKEFCEDVDGSGNNLTMFASQAFFSGINSAISWIFVDHPPLDPTVRSIADAKRSGKRPYWSHVLGRNVLEAEVKVIDGDETLTKVRIYEPGKVDHIRKFRREDDGMITWCLYEKRNEWREVTIEDDVGTGKTQFFEIERGIVTIDQIPLVPFITGRRDGRTFKLLPALRDAADLQKNLYQNESALEWNKRLGAYSMLSGNGVTPDKNTDGTIKKLTVGPNRVLYAPMNGAGQHGEWAYVQPDASIMTFLKSDIKETIQELRELCRQPLVASVSITVVQAGMAASKAKSAVKVWALGLKDALENAMVITCKFKNIDADKYDPTVSVYTDFDEFTDGKDLDALGTAVKENKISDETYRFELKRRRVLSDEFNEDQERERLLKQVPSDNGIDTADINQ